MLSMPSFIPRPFYILAACLILPFILTYVHGLNCWECSGTASPLCEGDHPGNSVPCPLDPDPLTGNHSPDWKEDLAEYQCFIMKAVPTATGFPEITKGCVLNQDFFVTNVSGLGEQYLQPGECYVHDDDRIFDRQVRTHEVTICVCNDKDDCNKIKIEDVGQEDIAKRKSVAVSGASSQRGALDYDTIFAIATSITLCINLL